jgi:hypothetical protein
VRAIQRRELEERAGDGSPAARLAALRARVLERRVDRVDADAFALGKAVLAGRVDDEDARTRGRELLSRAEALGPQVDALDGDAAVPLRRALGDAVMDALYAVERKAMSPRLARESGGAPPQVSA